jgi:hypothetical protein
MPWKGIIQRRKDGIIDLINLHIDTELNRSLIDGFLSSGSDIDSDSNSEMDNEMMESSDSMESSSSESSDESSDEGLFPQSVLIHFVEQLIQLNSTRYLQQRQRLPKSHDWINRIAYFETHRRFKHYFRMSKENFNNLLNLIEPHPIFHNNSTNPQRPVRLQLMVTLYYLGSGGNGGTWTKIGGYFGIGDGTVQLFTQRVMTAILSIKDQIIKWPKPGSIEYKRTLQMHLHLHGFPNCLGFVDGSHFAVYRKPVGKQGSAYWTRHDEYALNGTVIVDAETRILYAAIGCT